MTDKERIKVYVNRLPDNCYECKFCGKFKAPADRPEIECMHCNLMKKLDTRSELCPLKTIQSVQNEKVVEVLKNVIRVMRDCGNDDYFHYCEFFSYVQDLIKEYGGENVKN